MQTNYRINPSLPLNILVVLSLFFLAMMTACSGGPGLGDLRALQAMALAPAPPPGDVMHVLDSTYVRIKQAFDANFDVGSGAPVLFVEQELTWDELAGHLPSDHAAHHGLMVDYGLRNDSMHFGISYLPLVPTPIPGAFIYVLPDSLYDLSHGQLTSSPAVQWRINHQTTYFNRVRVRHVVGGVLSMVDNVTDARAEVLAWEDELQVLHDENTGGHGDSTLFVVLRCIAKPDKNGKLRHRICFSMRLRPQGQSTGAYRDLLDNSFDPLHLMRMHGCDFGNLCPPGCLAYQQPSR